MPTDPQPILQFCEASNRMRSVRRKVARIRVQWLALLIAGFFAVIASPDASARSSAFVALYDDGAGVYERTAALQEILGKNYGFDEVSIEINIVPSELPGRVRKFLAATAHVGDRRLVWVSGQSGGDRVDPCPRRGDRPFGLSAATLMIAPDCYLPMIRIAGMTEHLHTAPIWSTLETAPPPLSVRLNSRTFAFLSLPNRHGTHVTSVDKLLLRTLLSLQGQPISPGYLLQVLRNGFQIDGSSFTPRLTVAPAKLAWATNLIGSEFRSTLPDNYPVADDAPADLPLYIGAARTRLFNAPDLNAGTFTLVDPDQPVRILRHDLTGRMAFIRTANDNFGWVMVDALQKR